MLCSFGSRLLRFSPPPLSLPKPIKRLKEGGSEARVTSLLFVCPLLPLPLLLSSPLPISPLSPPPPFPGIQLKTLGDSMTPEPSPVKLSTFPHKRTD